MYQPIQYHINELYGLTAKDKTEIKDGGEYLAEKLRERFDALEEGYIKHFGEPETPLRYFSAPGRTEISGNNTDLNGGKVLMASVDHDIIAAAETMETPKIVIKSENYEENVVDLSDLNSREDEKGKPEAMIRGIVSGFEKAGMKIGGFKAYTSSKVEEGSGLSASAAFEVLVGTMLSYLFNGGKVDPARIAKIAGKAEKAYFGKECSLSDQLTSSIGGFVAIDFKEQDFPVVEQMKFDLTSFGHALCLIDTKSAQNDVSGDIDDVYRDMKAIAEHFAVDNLRRLCKQDIILNIKLLRNKFGDRATLRALHFFDENDRVDKLIRALKEDDFSAFLNSINDSGNSSFKYLQNAYSPRDVRMQPLSVGLNVSEVTLARKGACRIHGSGFAGTVQAFVPNGMLKAFKMNVEAVFGANSCCVVKIRNVGGTEIAR